MYGSDFQKNKPQRCKIGIKNEVKAFHFGDHKKKSKKKVFAFFSNQCAACGFNSFSKSGPLCEKLSHPWSRSTATFYRNKQTAGAAVGNWLSVTETSNIETNKAVCGYSVQETIHGPWI